MNKLVEIIVLAVVLGLVAYGAAIYTGINAASVFVYFLGGIVIVGFVSSIREEFRFPNLSKNERGIAISMRLTVQACIQLLSRVAIGALVIVFMLQGGFWFVSNVSF